MNRDTKIFAMILAGFLLSCVAFLCFAETDTLRYGVGGYTGGDHIELYEGAPTTNQNPNAVYAEIGNYESGEARNCIIYFDLSSIDSGNAVDSAFLWLYSMDSDGSADHDIAASQRAVVFNEATWNVYSTGNSWQTAGARGANDRYSPEDTVTLSTTVDSIRFDITASADSFVNKRWDNHGWITNWVVTNSGSPYWEWATEHGIDEALRPRLIITYSPMEEEGGGGVVVKKAVLGKVELP